MSNIFSKYSDIYLLLDILSYALCFKGLEHKLDQTFIKYLNKEKPQSDSSIITKQKSSQHKTTDLTY